MGRDITSHSSYALEPRNVVQSGSCHAPRPIDRLT